MMSAGLLPIFLDLRDRLVVVAGASPGAIAFAARAVLLGARVRLVASDVQPVREAGIAGEIVEAVPGAGHLAGASLLVAGSAKPSDDTAILEEAARRGLLAVDLGGAGRAYLGAEAGSGRVRVAATTCGASPELERRLATAAASALRPEHERFADILATIRAKLEERFPSAADRAAIWEQILDSPVMLLLESGHDDEAAEMADRMAWGTG